MARRGFIALSLEVGDDDVDGFVAAVADVLAERAEVVRTSERLAVPR